MSYVLANSIAHLILHRDKELLPCDPVKEGGHGRAMTDGGLREHAESMPSNAAQTDDLNVSASCRRGQHILSVKIEKGEVGAGGGSVRMSAITNKPVRKYTRKSSCAAEKKDAVFGRGKENKVGQGKALSRKTGVVLGRGKADLVVQGKTSAGLGHGMGNVVTQSLAISEKTSAVLGRGMGNHSYSEFGHVGVYTRDSSVDVLGGLCHR